MKTYSKEFKEKVIARMFPPHNAGIPELSYETGIPKKTLYRWRNKYLKKQPMNGEDTPSASLSSNEKFHIVIETASLNEAELSEYCRKNGLYREQIEAWKTVCIEANEFRSGKVEREKSRMQARKIKELESELRRKEKALAEAAALLVLKKKLQTLWEEGEDVKSKLRSDVK